MTKTQKRMSILAILGVLFALILLSGGHNLKTASGDYVLAAGLETATPLPFDGLSLLEDVRLVTRIYYDGDRAKLYELSGITDPWEVHPDYILTDLSPSVFNQLAAKGYRLELDETLTAEYNQPLTRLPGQTDAIPGFLCYRNLQESLSLGQTLAQNYPTLVSWIDIGDSWRKAQNQAAGFDIFALVISNKNIGQVGAQEKPAMLILSGLHARELAPTELALRFAEHLLTNYGSNPDITWIVDHHEIHIVLQANPDGRVIAEIPQLPQLNKRKNDNSTTCGTVSQQGVDLNRNFPFKWNICGGTGCSSGLGCDETYRGPSPASEPETQAIRDYGRLIFPDQREDDLYDRAPDHTTGVFIDIHSYSKLVLWPWGFQSANSPNHSQLRTLGRKFSFFNNYIPYQAYNLYPTDGTTDEFFYGDLGVAAYTFEIGNAFRQDCNTFNNQIYPDNLQALLYAVKVLRTPYLTPAGPESLNVATTPLVKAGSSLTVNARFDDTRYFTNPQNQEPVQTVKSARLYINTPPWGQGAAPIPMSPVDGSFNQPVEDAVVTVPNINLPSGKHMAFVHGYDGFNFGSVSSAFFYVYDDFSVDKTPGTLAAWPGETIPYTITAKVQINGSYTWQLDLLDELPDSISVIPGTLYLDGTPAPQIYDPLTNKIQVNINRQIINTSQVQITFQALLDDAVQAKTIQSNLIAAGSLNSMALGAPDITNPAVTVMGVDLVLSKTASTTLTLDGELITYTLQLQNQGTTTATEVMITDNMPIELDLLYSNGCLRSAVITCPVGDLPAGESVTYMLVVSTAIPGTYTNVATATATTYELYPPDNIAQAVVVVELDTDKDGVSDTVEFGAPNSGDGNKDGILDWTQPNVASLLDRNGEYITLESASGGPFANVRVQDTFIVGLAISRTLTNGIIQFTLFGSQPGFTDTVTITLHSGIASTLYLAQTALLQPDGTRWVDLEFDGTTGALWIGNQVILHLLDGDGTDLHNTGTPQIMHAGGPANAAFLMAFPLIFR